MVGVHVWGVDSLERGTYPPLLLSAGPLSSPSVVGVHGRGLEHERGGTVHERAVHDVRVPRDPPHVRDAGEDVSFFQPEGVLGGHARVQQVPGGGVRHPLRPAGGPRRVEDEQEVLRTSCGAAGGRGGDVIVEKKSDTEKRKAGVNESFDEFSSYVTRTPRMKGYVGTTAVQDLLRIVQSCAAVLHRCTRRSSSYRKQWPAVHNTQHRPQAKPRGG